MNPHPKSHPKLPRSHPLHPMQAYFGYCGGCGYQFPSRVQHVNRTFTCPRCKTSLFARVVKENNEMKWLRREYIIFRYEQSWSQKRFIAKYVPDNPLTVLNVLRFMMILLFLVLPASVFEASTLHSAGAFIYALNIVVFFLILYTLLDIVVVNLNILTGHFFPLNKMRSFFALFANTVLVICIFGAFYTKINVTYEASNLGLLFFKYYEMVYFSAATFFTVGYGEINASIVAGGAENTLKLLITQFLCITEMFMGLFFLGLQFSALINREWRFQEPFREEELR